MADKKISALAASTTPLAGTEVLPIVQSGATVKVAVSDLTAGRSVSASSLTASTDNVIIGTTAKGVTTGSAIPLGLGVNNTVTAITIDTSSNVGVGTVSPASKLHVSGGPSTLRLQNTDNASFSGVEFFDSAAARGQIFVGGSTYGSFGGAGSINYSANSGPHVWYTNYAERMRLAASGDLTATIGNLVIGTAGKGITTGGATALGFGVNNSTTDMTLDASSNLLVGASTSAGAANNVKYVTGGIHSTVNGSGFSVPSGTPTTMFTLTNTSQSQTWIVSADLQGEGTTAYACVYIVTCINNSVTQAALLVKGALAAISVSGLNVQYTQASGGTKTNTQFSAIRIM